MLFSRHLTIIVFSVFFIGAIIWWQEPETAVSAMARGEYNTNPYSIVKNYWQRMDHRQFELALEMTGPEARNDHLAIQEQLSANPFLSIQKINIELTSEQNMFLVETTLGSSIDEKKRIAYLVLVEQAPGGWKITSLKSVS